MLDPTTVVPSEAKIVQTAVQPADYALAPIAVPLMSFTLVADQETAAALAAAAIITTLTAIIILFIIIFPFFIPTEHRAPQ